MLFELVLATQLTGASINPRGSAYKPGFPRDSIFLRDSLKQGLFLTDTTDSAGKYSHSFNNVNPRADTAILHFWKGGDTANIKDLVSNDDNDYLVPPVVLYAPGQRHFTVSSCSLDLANFPFNQDSLEGILENLSMSPPPTPGIAMLFGGDSTPIRSYSQLVADVRGDLGDTLRLSLRGRRNDTIFVSDTLLIANERYGDAMPIEDTTKIPTEWNYGNWHVPVPRETIPPAFRDFGVARIVSPTDTTDSGLVITPEAIVKNYGGVAGEVRARMIIGSDYQAETTFASLQPGESAHVVFPEWRALVPGNYPVKCSTLVSGDSNSGNDFSLDSTFVPGTGIEEEYEQPVKPFDRMPTVLTQSQYRNMAQKHGWKAFSPIGSLIGKDYVGPAYIRDENNKLRKVILLDGNTN
jgi:hypothetical protein